MKKSIPLIVHQSLQPIIDEHVDSIEPKITKGLLLHLVDKDEDSDFYFKILKQEIQSGHLKYQVTIKPTNESNIDANSFWLGMTDVIQYLQKWIKIIETYNSTQTFYDDPILKEYQNTFIGDFDIVDEDASIKPFNFQQQKFLESYLNKSIARIEQIKSDSPEERQVELEDLLFEAEKILAVLTKESKRRIIKRLSRFWAKAQKCGLDILKEVFINVAAELMKKLITGS